MRLHPHHHPRDLEVAKGDGQRKRRVMCGVVGMISVGTSLPFIIYGGLNYTNWTHAGLIFAPIVCVLGLIAILASVFNWKKVL
jgi:hypothetical protein